jgi:CarD family transcriptional regulator
MAMFRKSDRVVHPVHGAGVVTEVKELHSLGGGKQYYVIELVGQPGTEVMVPTKDAEEVGLRSPVSEGQLRQVWRVLRGAPNDLPSNHDQRYQMLKDKLQAGDVLKVAEALRDMAGRREEKGHLTLRGKRLYDKGLTLLAGEIASAEKSDFSSAEREISRALQGAQ